MVRERRGIATLRGIRTTTVTLRRDLWGWRCSAKPDTGPEAAAMQSWLLPPDASVVVEGDRVAEDRHEAVAQVTVDGAAVLACDSVEALQALGRDQVGTLGAKPLRQCGEADEIGEHDGRVLALGPARTHPGGL